MFGAEKKNNNVDMIHNAPQPSDRCAIAGMRYAERWEKRDASPDGFRPKNRRNVRPQKPSDWP